MSEEDHLYCLNRSLGMLQFMCLTAIQGPASHLNFSREQRHIFIRSSGCIIASKQDRAAFRVTVPLCRYDVTNTLDEVFQAPHTVKLVMCAEANLQETYCGGP